MDPNKTDYLALKVLQLLGNQADFPIENFLEDFDARLNQAKAKLSNNQPTSFDHIAENIASEIYNSIYEQALHEAEDEDWEFHRNPVKFNQVHYNLWKQAVRERRTIQLKYNSATPGPTERLVDPYKSSAPYGEGYCHLRKEVRKFRFDRVLDIKLTNKTFIMKV